MAGNWTTAEIAEQRGRTVIVTGANSGLGRIVARELAVHGARVIIASRDRAKGAEAAAAIKAVAPSSTVEAAQLDLADLTSIREFADRIRASNDHIDLLVNNAGVMAAPYRRTPDGFELQFGTNHLGHFALTGLLLPLLEDRPNARVVTVSSNNHKAGTMQFDDLQGERRYSRWGAYAQSKLANLLFAFELDRRLRAGGRRLISVAAHPGYSATNLQLSAPPLYERLLMRVSNRLVAQSAEMGALPILFAATAAGLRGGVIRWTGWRRRDARAPHPRAGVDACERRGGRAASVGNLRAADRCRLRLQSCGLTSLPGGYIFRGRHVEQRIRSTKRDGHRTCR
jgi:NAD(P)-dependent dehydrogenase (short-subunit alcohol dehydrogenase family)